MTDQIRARLDELRWETNCFWIAKDALRAVLDRIDEGYCSACDPVLRDTIADALGVAAPSRRRAEATMLEPGDVHTYWPWGAGDTCGKAVQDPAQRVMRPCRLRKDDPIHAAPVEAPAGEPVRRCACSTPGNCDGCHCWSGGMAT